ncbi:MAG: hypothetical protein N3A66_06035 [Planctomycetota bacterium]|nr:hypothetical protein [Planctomycetota bacterium]
MAGHPAIGMKNIERDIAIIWHFEFDSFEAGPFEFSNKPSPIHRWLAILHGNRKGSTISQPDRRRLNSSLRRQNRPSPVGIGPKGEDAIRLRHLFVEKVLNRNAPQIAGGEIWLDRYPKT